jgi:RimJ/RimL family protein N-acetyltransferase
MIETDRLLLREWRDDDRDAFAALNADPVVMEYLPKVLTREESDAFFERLRKTNLWAAQTKHDGVVIGFIGLSTPRFEAHFTPCIEVGWRLVHRSWGHGYATEGARAAFAYGFDTLGLDEIVSFTVPANVRSRRVMERLGMAHAPHDDFDHPSLVEGHPLRRHVLYRLDRSAFHRARGTNA